MLKAVVAGGGLSGLTAAYLIEKRTRQAGFEVDVTLVESEDRLGGKIRLQDLNITCPGVV